MVQSWFTKRNARILAALPLALSFATEPTWAQAEPSEGEVEAQPPAPEETPPPKLEESSADESTASDGDESGDTDEDDAPAGTVAAASRAAPTAAQYAALEARLAALEAAKEEEELTALTEDEVDEAARQDVLKIYGFMDMGLQRVWVKEESIVSGYFEANAWTFAMGNVDFYFDANPHPDWRGLAEIRFTNAPRGRIANFGGIAGQFEREDTQQFDPNAATINAPVWLGAVVIERAWIEWKRYSSLRIRTGNFFTPFGIWNVDHGQPTLISAFLPQFMVQNYFPIRQTGVQALGSVFVKDWELGYHAWLSNGREDTTNLDFDDDKAVGTRLFLRNELGKTRLQIGGSLHHGRVANKVVNITAAPPIADSVEFAIEETLSYYETIIGADVSLDIEDTRIRAEGVAKLTLYEDGKRGAPALDTEIPGSYPADDWSFGGYLTVAQKLPFLGLEPYLYGDFMQYNRGFPDGLLSVGPGLNVHFNPSAMLKLQATRGLVFDWTEDLPSDASVNNSTSFVSRVVIVF